MVRTTLNVQCPVSSVQFSTSAVFMRDCVWTVDSGW